MCFIVEAQTCHESLDIEVIDLTKPVTITSFLIVDLTRLPDDPVDGDRCCSTPLQSVLPVEILSQIDRLSNTKNVQTNETDSNDVICHLTEQFVEPPTIDHRSRDTNQEVGDGSFIVSEPMDDIVKTCRNVSLDPILASSQVETDSNSLATDSVSGKPPSQSAELPDAMLRIDYCSHSTDQEQIDTTEDHLSTKDTVTRLKEELSSCHSEISRLKSAVVDLHSTESNFILLKRYRAKAESVQSQIDAELNRVAGKVTTVEVPTKKISFLDATRFTEFNEKLKKLFIEKGELMTVTDMVECLKLWNLKYGYGLSDESCFKTVSQVYRNLSSQLRKRRQSYLDERHSKYLKGMADPALNDPVLQAKLERNRKQ